MAKSFPPPSPAALPIFIAGPPISHPSRFFGRERELKRIFGLLKRLPLQNAAIIGPRRSGKTSLLHYLQSITHAAAFELRAHQRNDWLAQPENYRWVFVDFQDPRMGKRRELLNYLLSQLEIATSSDGDLAEFLNIISHHLQTPTIIMFDELGVAMQRYAELDDPFWEGLRSLATNQVNGNLAFILASHEPPQQLAQHHGLGSPFFNIFGYTATLGPLTRDEAHALIASSPLAFSAADTAWIIQHSECWPMRLQILCRERLQSLEDSERGDNWRQEALRQLEPFGGHLDDSAQPADDLSPALSPLLEPLSERELEVLRLIAKGLANQDIAQTLVIAVSTVKTHINSIYGKLEARSRTQAIARARALKLL